MKSTNQKYSPLVFMVFNLFDQLCHLAIIDSILLRFKRLKYVEEMYLLWYLIYHVVSCNEIVVIQQP